MNGDGPPLFGSPGTLEDWLAVSEIARNYGLLAAGLAAGTFGVWLAWQRTRAATIQADAAAKRQVGETFTAAIGQLGYSNDLEIRLGAIYALGELAKTAPSLHWPIMETLCAYAREHSRGEQSEGATSAESVDRPMAPDIEAIVTVLCGGGRRKSGS